ncbi:MAG TPA: amidase, partial [Arthrobacter bacterium]|nr:amidase [Arthrobacter sp.]
RDALRAGEVSAQEVTAHFLDRIAAQNPLLGAFVTVTAEQARADAAAADARYVRFCKDFGKGSGRDSGGSAGGLPLLHGMPVAFKDLTDVAGVVTTHGSAALDHKPAPADGALAAVLRAAGVVSLGKTQVP